MSGYVVWRHGIKNPWCFARFPYDGKTWEVTRYKGRRMYDENDAWKIIHQMQGEVENGTFNPLKYTRGETNVTTFLYEWLDECAGNWTPGTRNLYKSYIVNHIEPFFKSKSYQLNEVRKKAYQELKAHLEKKTKEVGGKSVPAMQPDYVKKVIDCLRSAMFYAFDCEIVGSPPPRIHRNAYQIPEKKIKATTKENQGKILAEIMKEHQPIYQFCIMHTKIRPANAMMLKWEDYDHETDSFIIKRGISYGEEVEYTKTKKAHVQPVHPEFKEIMNSLMRHREYPWSPYVFTCKESRHKHKRYTKEIFNSRWNAAAKTVGVDIDLYHGTRHTSITEYANTLTPEQTKILAGHTSVATTMKYYGKVNIETERALMSGKVVPFGKTNPPLIRHGKMKGKVK
jgi:integrase